MTPSHSSRTFVAFVLLLSGLVLTGRAADELLVAKRALGDGLWQLAGKHAAAAAAVAADAAKRDEARLVQLEALARAGQAEKLLAQLDAWTDAKGDGFRYWRAWADMRLGKAEAVRTLLAEPFADPIFNGLSRRLLARVESESGHGEAADAAFAQTSKLLAKDGVGRAENALEWARSKQRRGDAAGALAVLKQEGMREVPGALGDEARLLSAELAEATGDAAGARKVREALLAGGTNTSERTYVAAACALSEKLLTLGATNDAVRVASNAVARAQRPDLARRAGLALGFALLASPTNRAMGRAQISAIVRKDPDAPESAEAQLRLADALLAAGEDEAALSEYEVLLRSFPGHALDSHVLEGRGWAFLRLGRRTEAVGLFARAAQVASNAVDRARCRFKQADALAEDGRYEEAAAVYASVDHAELKAEAGFRQADALVRAKHPEQAAEVFRVLRKGGDETATEAALRLAALEAMQGRNESAIEIYGSLLDAKHVEGVTSAQRVRALAGRGRALYRAYRFHEAADDFAAVGKLQSSRKDEMDFLSALCLYGDGHEREAATAARTLLTRLPESPLRVDLQLWLATYDAGRREWPAAIAGFEACATNAQVTSARRADAFVRAARCAFELPDFQKALELAVGAMTNSVESTAVAAEALVMQGEALSELGRFEDAELVLERALRARGGESLQRRAALARANCYFVMGANDANRYRNAIDAYRSIQQDDGFSPSQRLIASFNMARSLEKLRRLDEAADIYYTHVVQAYWDGVRPDANADSGAENPRRVWFDASARQYFSRAVYILADHYESRGELEQAISILEYLVRAGLPSKEEANNRIARLKEKGGLK